MIFRHGVYFNDPPRDLKLNEKISKNIYMKVIKLISNNGQQQK